VRHIAEQLPPPTSECAKGGLCPRVLNIGLNFVNSNIANRVDNARDCSNLRSLLACGILFVQKSTPVQLMSGSGVKGENGSSTDAIRVRGARVHNLKNVDVDVPRDQLVVITGPSGSGKSSLAFDTIFAEGQRQYIESLSVYARQFLNQLERPDVDLVEGLQPTICIDQRPAGTNPRSTVATVTEIYDYLRVLFARLGEVVCYKCGEPICQQDPAQIQDRLMQFAEGTKTMLLAPMVRGRRGEHKEIFAQIRKAGFVRVRVDGDVYDMETLPELSPRRMHTIEAIVDRIIIRPGIQSRLGDSIDLAIRHGDGLVVACYFDSENHDKANLQGKWTDELFSTLYACPACNISYEELEPRTFSFNSPYGACPECEGLGSIEQFDPELIIPDHQISLSDGAAVPWKGLRPAPERKLREQLESFLASAKFEWHTPLSEVSPKALDKFIRGDGKKFIGILNMLEKELATTTSQSRIDQLNTFRGKVLCHTCHGSRLRAEAMSARIGGLAIHEITALAASAALQFFNGLEFHEEDEPIAAPLVTEIQNRLDFLGKVGVDYLTLNRPADTLSGGELQRVRLATSIGSGLVSVCYVLDEPSIGLHQRDNQRLIDALRDLQRQGNSVLVVEHDEAMMRQADMLIDVGPSAGVGGGQIVAQGTTDKVCNNPESVTGNYLSGRMRIEMPAKRRRASKTRSLQLEGAETNNLKNISLHFPLGVLVCVTGVSGSGKSSLINETLTRAIVRRLGGAAGKPGRFKSLRGVSQIDKVIEIDQSPIGRTPRSNAATYTGVFDEIRKVFAGTKEAKQRGFRASRFSFNVKTGRCTECQGHGVKKIEMNFLPDLFVTCDECRGARFNRQTLQVLYRNKSIANVLDLSVDEGLVFFENFPAICRLLESLRDVGLGYLPLGQPSTTLSGGEAQRVKLATQLARVDTGKTLYMLDEPTTGLHFDDIRQLLEVLGRLVDRGNTVMVIEHNLDVIKCADWIIDLGPEGGEGGGEVIVCGTPEAVAKCDASHTGRYLQGILPEDGP
jgi:excinuclease ABC subunit A